MSRLSYRVKITFSPVPCLYSYVLGKRKGETKLFAGPSHAVASHHQANEPKAAFRDFH